MAAWKLPNGECDYKVNQNSSNISASRHQKGDTAESDRKLAGWFLESLTAKSGGFYTLQ